MTIGLLIYLLTQLSCESPLHGDTPVVFITNDFNGLTEIYSSNEIAESDIRLKDNKVCIFTSIYES